MTSPGHGPSRGIEGWIPRLMKLAGVAVFLNETLLRTDMRPLALAVAALAMAGGNGLDTMMDRLLGK